MHYEDFPKKWWNKSFIFSCSNFNYSSFCHFSLSSKESIDAKLVTGSQFLGGTTEKFSKGEVFILKNWKKYVLLDIEEY